MLHDELLRTRLGVLASDRHPSGRASRRTERGELRPRGPGRGLHCIAMAALWLISMHRLSPPSTSTLEPTQKTCPGGAESHASVRSTLTLDRPCEICRPDQRSGSQRSC